MNYEANFYVNDYIEDFNIALKDCLNQRNHLRAFWLLRSRALKDRKIDILFEIKEVFNDDGTQTSFYIVKLVFRHD